MKLMHAALVLVIASTLPGCAGAPTHGARSYSTVDRPWVSLPGESDIERDRRAIRAMVGEYEVRFAFEETVVLAPGYVRRDSKDTGGFEAVVVVEDSPTRIVLQHLLVSEDGQHVTKHWRQDWTYEAASRFEFTQALTWRVRAVPAELTRGAWTQCVYEVNDAPRYCGTGRWDHSLGTPTWTSDPSWRPLPRREFTRRSDYDAIRAVNRHSIGPTGWTHEQDNTKVVRRGEVIEKSLVREFGFNDYRRISGFDFAPAYDYWRKTSRYWAQVRSAWAQRLDANAGLRLHTKIDGMALIIPLFTQAEAAGEGRPVDPGEIRNALDAWVTGPDATAGPASSAPAEPG
jgi:hypothetical protein